MMTVVIPETLWPLVGHFDPAGRESAGVALARPVQGHRGTRLLIGAVLLPSADNYVDRTGVQAVLSPEFVARAVATARRDKQSVVFFHTHPFSSSAIFSAHDDRGELLLGEFLDRRLPTVPHAAIVIGHNDHSARLLGKGPCTLERIGARIQRWDPSGDLADLSLDDNIYDRQIRVFGRDAQKQLAQLRVAVVGLGGTGSVIAQQLAHLGIGHFLLIDPDTIEASNLNRVVGAEPADVGQTSKVAVAARLILRIRPSAKVEAVVGSVFAQKEVRRLTSVDMVFGCTDSHGSRYVLNQLAYQFFVPVFDVGVAIAANGNVISHIFGRAQMLAPGLACLTCSKTLDPEQVRRDMMSGFERQLDPYVLGGAPAQPAVISLNSTVSSMVVTMFLSAVAGIPVMPRHQIYDAMRGVVRSVENYVVPNCVTCSGEGAFAQGDVWPLPGRSE